MALRDGQPFLSFAVQGGDAQDQNLLQFFLNMVEFKMDVQQAVEAANVNSYQMQNSFGDHTAEPGRLIVRNDTPAWVQSELAGMGYRIEGWERTSGPDQRDFHRSRQRLVVGRLERLRRRLRHRLVAR